MKKTTILDTTRRFEDTIAKTTKNKIQRVPECIGTSRLFCHNENTPSNPGIIVATTLTPSVESLLNGYIAVDSEIDTIIINSSPELIRGLTEKYGYCNKITGSPSHPVIINASEADVTIAGTDIRIQVSIGTIWLRVSGDQIEIANAWRIKQ